MNSSRLLSYSLFDDRRKASIKLFLSTRFDLVNLNYPTLYENCKHFGIALEHTYKLYRSYNTYDPAGYFYFWKQRNFEFNSAFIDQLLNNNETPTIFKLLIQYRLFATFNWTQQQTIAYVRETFFASYIDATLQHPGVLANLIFFNRINENQVVVEIVLFCSQEIDEKVLNSFTAVSDRISFECQKVTIHNNYLFWIYILYSHIFLNSHILTNSVMCLSWTCKDQNYIFEKIQNWTYNSAFYSNIFWSDSGFNVNFLTSFFNSTINLDFMYEFLQLTFTEFFVTVALPNESHVLNRNKNVKCGTLDWNFSLLRVPLCWWIDDNLADPWARLEIGKDEEIRRLGLQL